MTCVVMDQNLSLATNATNVSTTTAADIALLQRITYAFISPCIIACGVFGDVMTVFILTHPLLRRSNVIYTYLTFLAITDLCTLLSVIPMILWMLDWKLCSYTAALYYAHIGFPLTNAFMGASVWIVVFLTFSQFMAVCHPFHYGNLRSRKMCYWLTGIAYVFNFGIYAPWGARKSVERVQGECEYIACDDKGVLAAQWYDLYQWGREALTRLLPFVFVAYFNISILMTYRATKRDRLQRMADSQKRSMRERSEHEEKRLFLLLVTIVTLFFFCTIPAAPLTILVKDSFSDNLPFQIVRSIINLLEFTKFALNFYFYCLINPDIRRICAHMIMCRKLSRPARVKGQPVNHISQFTKSTKSTIREVKTDSSRRGSRGEDTTTASRRNSTTSNSARDRRKSSAPSMHGRTTTLLLATTTGENGAYDHLTVITEAETDSVLSHSIEPDGEEEEALNERTSML